MANILKKATDKLFRRQIEQKQQAVDGQLGISIYPTGDKPVLYASEAVLYMLECAPVWTALHKIAKGVASIPAKVMDKQTGEFIDHPVLKLLAKPDADITESELWEQCSHWYVGTGNVYIQALGYVEKAPISLRVMPSYSTTVIVASDGYADTFIARLLNIAYTYYRKEVIENGKVRFRFYAKDNEDFNELYHIKTFNPQVNANMAYGLSPLNAVFYEMRQYIEAAKSNLSTLLRSSRLSGLWRYKGILTDKQRQALEMQINAAYSGSNNAGRNSLIDANTDFQDLMKNARDMDYDKTSQHTAETIYKALDIPLPLINAENMTYDNYESSQYYLFKDAIIPLRKRLDQELTNFLMPRYGDTEERYAITFNPKDIPQLEPERNAQLSIKQKTGIYTMNELRRESEAEPLDGGQFVYGTAGMTPIATDDEDEYANEDSNYDNTQESQNNTTEKPAENEKPIEESEEENEKGVSKEEFIKRLKNQVNKDGTARFTEDEINELAQEHFGK